LYPQTTGRVSCSPVTGMQMRDTKGFKRRCASPQSMSRPSDPPTYPSRLIHTAPAIERFGEWSLGDVRGPGCSRTGRDACRSTLPQGQALRGRKEAPAADTAVRAAAVLFSQAPFYYCLGLPCAYCPRYLTGRKETRPATVVSRMLLRPDSWRRIYLHVLLGCE